MEERGKRPLFIEAVPGGKIEHIDAAKLAVGRLANRALDGGGAIRVGRLPQHTEKGFCFAHLSPLTPMFAERKYASGQVATRRIAATIHCPFITAS